MDFISNNEFESSDCIIGISVGHFKDGNFHNKLLYKLDGEVREIHLGWHYVFFDESLTYEDSYIWKEPSKIPISRLRSLAAKCKLVGENYSNDRSNAPGLPYAIGYYSDRTFNKDGIYSPDSGKEYGMTCATFILTLFESVGLQLINWKTWKTERKSDQKWFKQIVKLLEKGFKSGDISKEHLDNVKSESKCARYRPEEVFSSVICLSKDTADFACCSGFGERLVRPYVVKLPPQFKN